MPASKQVNPTFKDAIKKAIQDFREAKRPLWRHHFEEIAIIENILNRAEQTNRELRDSIRQGFVTINSKWQNWLIKSVLVDYIDATLRDPRFNVEKMYEEVIDQQGETIALQDKLINKLGKEKERLTANLPAYRVELEEKLKNMTTDLHDTKELLRKTEEKLERSDQVNQALNTQMAERDKNYQTLLQQYHQTLNEKQQVQPKKIFTVPKEALPCNKTAMSEPIRAETKSVPCR